jgi:hypothetical protein
MILHSGILPHSRPAWRPVQEHHATAENVMAVIPAFTGMTSNKTDSALEGKYS